MAEQSHRDEMNAAIRAQRERQAARSNAAATAVREPLPERRPEPERRKSVLGRLLGR